MAIKRYRAEQIVTSLRQIKMNIGKGNTTPKLARAERVLAKTGPLDALTFSSRLQQAT